jgi:hypothetical protein
MELMKNIPSINMTFKSRQDCDDEYVAYEGGHGHSHGGGHGHSHDNEKGKSA